MDKVDDGIGEQEPISATERFRAHLRARLNEMRENARRIGASASYIESFDRSTQAVMTALSTKRPVDTGETAKPDAKASAGQKTPGGRTRNSAA
jgi:hypothetical protein